MQILLQGLTNVNQILTFKGYKCKKCSILASISVQLQITFRYSLVLCVLFFKNRFIIMFFLIIMVYAMPLFGRLRLLSAKLTYQHLPMLFSEFSRTVFIFFSANQVMTLFTQVVDPLLRDKAVPGKSMVFIVGPYILSVQWQRAVESDVKGQSCDHSIPVLTA